MTQMMQLIEMTSQTLTNEMQASAESMAESNKALSESLSTEVISKAMGQNNQLAVKLASMEAALGKSIKNVEGKLVNNAEIGALSAAQQNTSAQVRCWQKARMLKSCACLKCSRTKLASVAFQAEKKQNSSAELMAADRHTREAEQTDKGPYHIAIEAVGRLSYGPGSVP